jgi:hypothetical protein
MMKGSIEKTLAEYDSALESCKSIFIKKTSDYGTSWRVLRPISIVDQIYIKAQRIRTIQETKAQKIGDDIPSEFRGIVNYSVIGLIQLELDEEKVEQLDINTVAHHYDRKATTARSLMQNKNHDYGEAWREMSMESFVDLILMKLLRMRQIIANDGKTLISEGLDANYSDIINYSLFALIRLAGEAPTSK